jgi:hypothetical protein
VFTAMVAGSLIVAVSCVYQRCIWAEENRQLEKLHYQISASIFTDRVTHTSFISWAFAQARYYFLDTQFLLVVLPFLQLKAATIFFDRFHLLSPGLLHFTGAFTESSSSHLQTVVGGEFYMFGHCTNTASFFVMR